MKIKKALALLLVLCLTLAMVPATAFAESETSGTCGKNLTWSFDESTGTLTISGTGAMTSSPWSNLKDQIIHINIEEGVTSIRDSAFGHCRRLLDVHLPETLRSIGGYAFSKCEKLSSIRIPDATKYFGFFAFNDCTELKRVDYSNLRNWCLIQFDSWYSNPLCNGADLYFDGAIARNIEIPDDFDGVGICQFQGCASITNVTIPMGVTRINAIAFEGCKNLVSVSIPDTVNFIGDYAFESSGIKSLRIPDTVTVVSANLCHWCYDLEEVTIGRDVTRIEDAAFNTCSSLDRVKYRGDRPSYYGIVAFSFTPGNKEIYYPAGNASWQEYLAGYSGSSLYNAYSVNDYYDGSYEKPPVDHGDTIVYNGHKYVRYDVDESLTWQDAKEYCETLGGHLATITSEAEQNAVESIVVGGKSDQYWLGAEKTYNRFSEGEWITGEPWTYENWVFSKDITHHNNLAMVRISNSDTINDARALGRWDIASDKLNGFICEFGSPTGDSDDSNGLQLESSAPKKAAEYNEYKLQLQFSKEIELDFSGNKGIHIMDFNTDKEVRTLNLLSLSDYYVNGDGVTGNKFTVTRAFAQLPVGRYYIKIDKGFFRAKQPGGDGTKAIFEGICEKGVLWFDFSPTRTCKLDELTDLDYLAFSSLSYADAPSKGSITIREMLSAKWTDYWEYTDISNCELYEHIANWKVLYPRIDPLTGFEAYAFINDYNEIVIAFRGSELRFDSSVNSLDSALDWFANDFYMILGGNGEQVETAFDFYDGMIKAFAPKRIAVTGHSLGGGLAEIVAARYRIKGVSFNSAPFLDIAFHYYPKEMAKLFSGVDNFSIVSYANEFDCFVGNMRTERIKPKTILNNTNWPNEKQIDGISICLLLAPLFPKIASLGLVGIFEAYNHLLPSMVTRDANGQVCLSSVVGHRYNKSIVNQMTLGSYFNDIPTRLIQLGTTAVDKINPLYTFPILRATASAIYGGNGYDSIFGTGFDDIISGGNDGADIDGLWGNDTYYIYKGDAVSTINDVGGKDVVILCGFDGDEEIAYKAEGKFVNVMVNGETVVKIQGNRSGCKDKDGNSFFIRKDRKYPGINIEKELETGKYYKKSFLIGCPVNIEIYDEATGEVVYTVQDGEVGAYYTDYGNFYVFPENEEGTEFVKQVDLVQGYAIRIVGYDAGTMTIDAYDTNGSSLYNELAASGIEVTPTMVATIEEVGEQKNLVIDYDGDGVTDSVVPLAAPVVVSFDANGGTGEMAAVSVAAGGAYELPECGFIAPEGQTFQGWDVNGTVYVPGDKVTVTEDVTIKALWSAASGGVTPPSGESGGSQTPPTQGPVPTVTPPSTGGESGSTTAPSTRPTSPNDTPRTGDFSTPALWVCLMAASGLAAAVLAHTGKKKRK